MDWVKTHKFFVFCAIAGGYAVLAWLSKLVGGSQDGIAGFWAPNVILFAIFLRNPALRSPASWIAIFASNLAINLLHNVPLLPSIGFAILSLTYVMALIAVAERIDPQGYSRREWRFKPVILSLMIVSPMAGLVFGLAAQLALGWDFAVVAQRITLGNLVGAALFMPFVMSVTCARLRRLTKARNFIVTSFWLIVSAGTMVVAQSHSPYAFAFTTFVIMFAGIRLSHLSMGIVCLVVGVISVTLADSGNVMNLGSQEWLTAPAYQFAICVNILMPYFVCVLIGQIRTARRDLAANEERLRRAVDEAPVGIFTVALDGRIIECNPAYAGMLGLQRSEVEGRFVQDFSLPEDVPASEDIRRRAHNGEFQTISFQKRYRRSDGSLFWVEIFASNIRDPKSGQVVMVSQAQDIDARKRAESELSAMKDRWDFALASAGQGFWDHLRDNDQATYSSTWTTMLGYEPGEIDGNTDRWLALIHPDDVPAVLVMDLDHQAGRVPHFELEYRMRHRAGHWLWILDRGRVVERHADGRVRRMIGTLTDISQRKSIEERLERTAAMLSQEKERLRVTLESIGDAVICTDPDGRVSFMNSEAERLTGILAEDCVGHPLQNVYAARPDPQNGDMPRRADGRISWHGSQLIRADGARLTIREVTAPILSDDGTTNGDVIVFQDFTEMRQLQRELQHAAHHDDLTGLVNRSGFMASLEAMRERSLTDCVEHQLLYIDLDNFKQVNDTGGHAAGDVMLRLVAKAISDTVRAGDVVARLGGDEFGVVLPGCPQSYAKLMAHAIREQILSLKLERDGHVFQVGASIGLAMIDAATDTIDEVIAEADAGCYIAKAKGRATASAQRNAVPPAQAKAS